ncbi:MAG: CHASE domain-containing protein [Magnetococcales bacterium]|nr:CHASE domain-containing protein [Magnetococcales bacterium]
MKFPAKAASFSTSFPSKLKRHLSVWLVFFLGLFISATGFDHMEEMNRREMKNLFESGAQERLHALRKDIDHIQTELEDIRSFFNGSSFVERQEFQAFVQPMLRRHPYIQALEWIPRVTRSERGQYESEAAKDYPGFQITERVMQGLMLPAPPREEYFPVYYVEPYQGNEKALGFDLGSSSTRLEALNQARDSGLPSVTGRVVLVQASDVQAYGFLVLSPIYQPDALITGVAERRRHLKGFVLGVFRIGPLVEASLAQLAPRGIDFEIRDESASEEKQFLYYHVSRQTSGRSKAEATKPSELNNQLQFNVQFEVGGRQWSFAAYSTPTLLGKAASNNAWLLFFAGLLLTLVLTLYLIRLLRVLQERQQMTEILNASQKSLTKAQQIAHLGNWEWDIVSGKMTLSEEIHRLFGRPLAAFGPGYQSYMGFVHPEDRERVREIRNLALCKKNADFQIDYRIVLPNGSESIVQELGEVVRNELGVPVSVSGIIQDITEHRLAANRLAKAVESLEEREHYLQSILDTSLDAIITMTPKGVVVGFNPTAEQMFGYKKEEIMGRDLTDFIIPPELKELHRNALRRFAGPFSSLPVFGRRMEMPGLRADGSRMELEMALVAVQRKEETLFVGSIYDMTERKQLLQSLKETLEEAESANRSKSEFLANMSHEIRSPMNAIIGMTDLVLGSRLSEEQRDHLETVQRSSQTMLELLNGILDLSRIEAGQLVLEYITFNLRNCVEEVCQTLAVKAHMKELELYCQLESDLPEILVGDPLRLNQVLTNLLSNAIKFTDEGEVGVHVQLEAAEGGSPSQEEFGANHPDGVGLRFIIWDTGIGIAEENLSRVFQRFTQGDGSTTREYGGTGLGLTISRRLVYMMAGDIAVESAKGRGSVFQFTARFGQHDQLQSTVVRPDHLSRPSWPGKALSGVRVLLCDGHATGRGIVREMLVHFDARVMEAWDADSFSRVLTREKEQNSWPDVVIFDHLVLVEMARDSEVLAPLFAKGAGLLVMFPGQLNLEKLSLPPEFQRAVSIQKPVRLFRLLEWINIALGREQEAPRAEGRPRFRGRRSRGRLNILLVEDLPDNQVLATEVLEEAGHRVAIANHGLEALHLIKESRFDLILMDLQMPEMGGLEATRRIRHPENPGLTPKDVPIIAVTARVREGDRQECEEAGMNGFVAKPYRVEALLDAIKPFLPPPDSKKRRQKSTRKVVILTPVEVDSENFLPRMRIFLDEGPKRLQDLGEAFANENVRQSVKQIECLMGLAEAVGASRVASVALRLRGQVEVEDWEEARSRSRDLEAAFHKARKALMEKGEEV